MKRATKLSASVLLGAFIAGGGLTSSSAHAFKSRLKVDINKTAGLAGVAFEVKAEPHLTGHPDQSKPIFHYFNIRGYSNDGSTRHYEDSATTVWPTVPPYSSKSTSTIVTVMGGRGYHW